MRYGLLDGKIPGIDLLTMKPHEVAELTTEIEFYQIASLMRVENHALVEILKEIDRSRVIINISSSGGITEFSEILSPEKEGRSVENSYGSTPSWLKVTFPCDITFVSYSITKEKGDSHMSKSWEVCGETFKFEWSDNNLTAKMQFSQPIHTNSIVFNFEKDFCITQLRFWGYIR